MNRRALAAIALAACCSSCREDMQKQPKYTPLELSRFYPDGRSARPIPAGTVATDEAEQDPALATGMVNGKFVATIPMTVDKALLEHGRERFDIYCSPCHGRTGNGYGPIVARGFKQPADLTSDDVRKQPPGYIFAVITRGYGAMASYAYQIRSVRDRWAIIAYIRALELSRRATLDDVPPEQRRKLEEAK